MMSQVGESSIRPRWSSLIQWGWPLRFGHYNAELKSLPFGCDTKESPIRPRRLSNLAMTKPSEKVFDSVTTIAFIGLRQSLWFGHDEEKSKNLLSGRGDAFDSTLAASLIRPLRGRIREPSIRPRQSVWFDCGDLFDSTVTIYSILLLWICVRKSPIR